jgi:hypothetical protein
MVRVGIRVYWSTVVLEYKMHYISSTVQLYEKGGLSTRDSAVATWFGGGPFQYGETISSLPYIVPVESTDLDESTGFPEMRRAADRLSSFSCGLNNRMG